MADDLIIKAAELAARRRALSSDGGDRVLTKAQFEAWCDAEQLIKDARLEAEAIKEAARREGYRAGWKAATGEARAARWSEQSIRVGPGLVGRVVDSCGELRGGEFAASVRRTEADAHGPVGDLMDWPVERPPPDPETRRRVDQLMPTGLRAVDGLAPLAWGQRVGVVGVNSVSRTHLLTRLALGIDADRRVVCLGVGGPNTMYTLLWMIGGDNTVFVVSTPDEPIEQKQAAPRTATAIAEYFRSQGHRVLLVIDAMWALEPQLIERGGNDDKGTMTAFYGVREPSPGCFDAEINQDDWRARKELAWPAIDLSSSFTSGVDGLLTPERRALRERALRLLARWERIKSTEESTYRYGDDPEIDEALDLGPVVEAFASQEVDEIAELEDTLDRLRRVVE